MSHPTAAPSGADKVVAPEGRFNFAQHLIECNSARGAKAAYIDDQGTLSYGALEERLRRLAAGLRAWACAAKSVCCC